MREPSRAQRIDRIIEALRELWHKHPDLRLGQLISNIANTESVFYIEDQEIEYRIEDISRKGFK